MDYFPEARPAQVHPVPAWLGVLTSCITDLGLSWLGHCTTLMLGRAQCQCSQSFVLFFWGGGGGALLYTSLHMAVVTLNDAHLRLLEHEYKT